MAQAGRDVSFLLRPASARALRSNGLRITSPAGDFFLPEPRVLDGEKPSGGVEILFFACKAEHLKTAAELARPLVGESTVVIPLLNGVEAPDTLCELLRPERVVGGFSRIFAERRSPGNIVHTGLPQPTIIVGERGGGRSARLAKVLRHLFSVEGMAIDESADIWTDLWKKLVAVCTLGVVGAVTRAPAGALFQVPETRDFMVSVADEIASVARAQGAAIAPGFASKQVRQFRRLPYGTTASMHRDLERGEPSELEAQLGAVRRYARESQVMTPVLDTVYAALLPGELRARRRLVYPSVDPRPAA